VDALHILVQAVATASCGLVLKAAIAISYRQVKFLSQEALTRLKNSLLNESALPPSRAQDFRALPPWKDSLNVLSQHKLLYTAYKKLVEVPETRISVQRKKSDLNDDALSRLPKI